jgi:hypothetical protein
MNIFTSLGVGVSNQRFTPPFFRYQGSRFLYHSVDYVGAWLQRESVMGTWRGNIGKPEQ